MSDTDTTTAPEADITDTTAATAATESTKVNRAPRTDLEGDIKRVCDAYILGQITPGEGKTLTPHFIAAKVVEARNDGTKVSGGAVAACLTRWVNIGYITAHEKPFAFEDYTDAGRTVGLGELKRQHTAALASARAAQREAAKGAAAAPAPAPADTSAVAENAPF